MPREIRFTISDAQRRQIANSDEAVASAVYAALVETAKLQSDETIEACWVKPQFSNGRSYPVRHAAALQFVVKGVVEHRCCELRFFAVSKRSVARAGSGGPSYRSLFC